MVFFKEGGPVGSDFFRDFAVIGIERGVGGFVIDGKCVGDMGAGFEGFVKPEGLAPFNGLEVAGVHEEKGEVRAEVHGAVELFFRKGEEVEKELVMIR